MLSGLPWKLDSSAIIVAAHPDDEIIGIGGQLPKFLSRVLVVHVTDGSPRNLHEAHRLGFKNAVEYANRRHKESCDALALAGISEKQCLTLGFSDQEASLHLAEIRDRLVEYFVATATRLVFTHPYEGGHPDHDATVFSVHQAIEILRGQQRAVPQLWEFASYHAGPHDFEAGTFLSDHSCPEYEQRLSDSERQLKQSMFDCFPTQKEMLARFPIAMERFRRAPDYDFSQPPHEGRLYYENFDWGMTGSRWRALAVKQRHELSPIIKT